jgi:hypothetical protein
VATLSWVRVLGRRRLSDFERERHDSFLADIQEHADPGLRHRGALRASLRHVGVRLFSGGPTLAGVAVAATLAALGAAMLNFAPPLHRPERGGDLPIWVNTVLTVGAFGLAFESARSPRAVEPGRFLAIGAAPLVAGSLTAATTLTKTTLLAWILRAGFALAAAAGTTVALAAIRGSAQLFRYGVIAMAGATAAVALANSIRIPLLLNDGDQFWALSLGFVTAGCALLAVALVRARPSIRGASG